MVYAPAAGIVSAIDLKERIGFAANRTLFYGVLGYSKARFTEPPVDQEFDMTGMAYVFGAENALNKRLVIGLE